MGDINHVKPMEKQSITKLDDDDEMGGGSDSGGIDTTNKISLQTGLEGGVSANANDIDNIISDEMVDINKFRY